MPGGKFSAAGTEGGGVAVKNAYGISAFPTMILIAPNRNIVEQDIWPVANGQYLAGVIENRGGIPATCPPVGINEVNNNAITGFISSYPNPANNQFNLKFNVEESANINFEVLNLLGEKVMEIPSVEYLNGSHTIQIPVENLANGTYFINLLSNNVKKDMCKMVIVK